jgi:hypothetical protein
MTINAYRRVSVGSIEEAEKPLHEGLACAGLQRGMSEGELRKKLKLSNLQLHRGQDEQSIAYQQRSAFISFSAPRMNYEVSSEVLWAEGVLNEGQDLALDDVGHFTTDFVSMEELALAAAFGSPGKGSLVALYGARLAVLVDDPLRALGEVDLAIDARFLTEGDRGLVAGRLADEHHEHEHEVTGQIRVPATDLQLLGVFREQSTLAGISYDPLREPGVAPAIPEDEGEYPWDVEYVCEFSSRNGMWTGVESYAPLPPQRRVRCPVELVPAAGLAYVGQPQRADLLLDGSRQLNTDDGRHYRVHACEQTGVHRLRVHLLRVE